MRFASLGSGSEGNSLLVECTVDGRTVRLLIDCGFGVREFKRRLARVGLAPADVDALLVTHEHSDHIGGASRVCASFDIPLYMTAGTALAGLGADPADARCTVIDSHACFELNGVLVQPVPVPHDAREPVQFVIDDGAARLGVLTDLGRSTAHVVRSMSRLDAIVLECNHDEHMLEAGDYPYSLKRRIGGGFGHLNNRAASALLGAIDHSRLRTVVAAHLSRSNNRPELAREALARAWGDGPESIVVADQDDGLDWIAV